MTIKTDAWTWMVDGDIPVIEQIFGLFPCVMWRYFVCSTVLLQEKKHTHRKTPAGINTRTSSNAISFDVRKIKKTNSLLIK